MAALKVGFLLISISISINCEFDVASMINSTQHLQDIERGGLYPHLPQPDNTINNDNEIDSRVGGSRPFYYGNILHPKSNSTSSGNTETITDEVSNLTPSTPPAASSGVNRPFYLGTLNRNSSTDASMEKFLNKTTGSMTNGLCTKEVKTSSLLRPNELPVKGNGSDPSLSRIQVCCEGYQRNPQIFRKCEPICSKGCVNGICVAPETCSCYPEYVRNSIGQCVVTCPRGCENGVCNGNSCTCYDGFELESSGKYCVIKCNPGYKVVNGKCTPVCSKGCENGICIAPETCQCQQQYGWQIDPTGSKCIPKCDRTCLNGFCSGPNQCSCALGYVKDVIDPYRCNPTCNPQCENAICSGPNMCLCYQGFVKDRNIRSGHKCVKM